MRNTLEARTAVLRDLGRAEKQTSRYHRMVEVGTDLWCHVILISPFETTHGVCAQAGDLHYKKDKDTLQ